jgi:hypothetical protein
MSFYCDRPTEEQIRRLTARDSTDAEFVRKMVTGFDGVKESDLFRGGDKTPVIYNKEDFDEAIGDLPEIFDHLTKELIKLVTEYRDKGKELEKNSSAG